MSRCLLRLVTVVAAATCLLVPPAHAADEIGLSNDGATWSSSLPQPLFDPAFRWVPGDSETASFYVRNQGPSSALMTVEARSADTDDLLENDDITLRARADGGQWVSLDNGVASESLTARSIGQGGVVQIDVNASFDPASTSRSQDKRVALRFAVTLADALEGPGDDDSDGADDGAAGSGTGGPDASGIIPSTGSVVDPLLLLIGAIMVGVGLALAARRRREEAPRG